MAFSPFASTTNCGSRAFARSALVSWTTSRFGPDRGFHSRLALASALSEDGGSRTRTRRLKGSPKVEVTDEFKAWWHRLTEAQRISVERAVLLLEDRGPHLPFPYSSRVNGSRHSAMCELRVQHQGHPYRVLYIFDPRRVALCCWVAKRQAMTMVREELAAGR